VEVVGILSTYYTQVIYQIQNREKTRREEEGRTSSSGEGKAVSRGNEPAPPPDVRAPLNWPFPAEKREK
jgi:hypothetical protein